MSGITKGVWTKRKMVGVGLPGQIGWAIDYNEDQEQVVDYVYEEADADLICAAPDLLEALEGLVKSNEDHNERVSQIVGKPAGWHDSYLDQARAAIAKARGQ